MNQRELRFAAHALPVTVDGEWAQNEARLREAILVGDVSEFLCWPVVLDTMRFVSEEYNAQQLNALVADAAAAERWLPALQESPVGYGAMYDVGSDTTSGNAIHAAAHLETFEDATGLRIEEMGAVVEFGGGYGCLCRLIHGLGFRGRYILHDLPVASLLQQYYVETVGVGGRVHYTSCLDDLAERVEGLPGPRLFVATWSLSEAPPDLREVVWPLVDSFDAYLIAYQEQFEGVDNIDYFDSWQAEQPEVRWQTTVIPGLPGPSYYMMGAR